MSGSKKLAAAHGELLDDGSYHCLLSYPNEPEPVQCNAIEWSRSEFVEHLRNAHRLNVSERPESGDVVIDGELPPIVHRGAHHDRVEGEKCNYHGCLREKAFADQWEKTNADDHILAALSTKLVPKGTAGSWRPASRVMNDEYRKRAWAEIDEARELTTGELYSQRDAIVAATVVQWLGTNVGFCWLEETLKKAGYSVVLEEMRAKEIDARLEALEQRDAAHALATVIEQILSQRVGQLGLAALRFAATHCSNEADLFEEFQRSLVAQKMNRREPFSISVTEGPNGLRAIANTLRDVFGAIAELEGALALRKKKAAQRQPDASIAPQTSGQTSPASS